MIQTSFSIFEKNISRPETLFFIENRAFEGFWIWDLLEKSIYINQQFLKKLGYKKPQDKENFTIEKLLNLTHGKPLLTQILENSDNKLTLEYFTSARELITFEVEYLAVKDYLNRVTGYIFANTEILGIDPSNKDIENLTNELFAQKEIFSELEKIAEIGGWEINLKTGDITWTKQVYKIHEVDESFNPRVDVGLDFYFPDDRRKVVRALQETIKKSKPFDLNCRILTAKNNMKWVRCFGKIFRDSEGKPAKIIGVFQDITKQRLQSEKLRISENTFRGNFEYAAIGMAILDEYGTWIEVNKKLCQIVGYSAEELKTKTFHEITHPEDLDADVKLLNDLADGTIDNYQLDKRYINKNGAIIHVTLSASVVRNNDGTPYQYTYQIVDITANVEAKNKLETAIKKLEAVFNASTQVSIVATDRKGLIKNFNTGAENLLGYKAAEMIGIHTADFLHSAVEIETRKETLSLTDEDTDFEVFANLVENGFETREWTYTHKEGYEFPVLLTVTEIVESGEIVGYLGVAIDLTEIKKVEREITSLLEITKDQNERLKNFAHIVSHNLRSHASNFKMLLELLVHDHPEFKENEFILYLKTASNDLKETITHLNEVVQLNTTLIENLEVVNLQDVVEMNIRNLQVFANEKQVVIENNISKGEKVLGITAYISSIINNLLSNAIKYSKAEGTKYVSLNCLLTEDSLELIISDNGIGIDLQKNGAKIFGMYKTFHTNTDARGIGLFITKNQVEAMGGKIEVESKLNQGTTFKITFKI
ncbi:PAS domain S-box protein [Flavobacterium antarcticum]|uniref:sensor histidine kinase n=1 Tax=Flavobacterium antarcticum TaxID=271155 RepID=UPI0003B5E393|nr:PAS domain-containing sensor histidine kinase [Flavobacterium antarcticum]